MRKFLGRVAAFLDITGKYAIDINLIAVGTLDGVPRKMRISEGRNRLFQNRRSNFRTEHAAELDNLSRIDHKTRCEGVGEGQVTLEGQFHLEAAVVSARKNLHDIGAESKDFAFRRSHDNDLLAAVADNIPAEQVHGRSSGNDLVVKTCKFQ